MEKSVIINRIKELCDEENDRVINLKFSYNDNLFHAKYLFLGNRLYVTNTLIALEVEDLDMDVLEKIGDVLNIYDN